VIVLGGDPSSSVVGICLSEVDPGDGALLRVIRAEPFFPGDVVRAGDDKQVRTARARSMRGLTMLFAEFSERPDLVVYEQVAVARNTNTIRLLSYYEAMFLLCSSLWGVPCLGMTATMARRLALGNGGLSKEDCRAPFMDTYGGLYAWPEESSSGSADVIDAAVMSIAGPRLLLEKHAA